MTTDGDARPVMIDLAVLCVFIIQCVYLWMHSGGDYLDWLQLAMLGLILADRIDRPQADG